jgi:hypothetical protein
MGLKARKLSPTNMQGFMFEVRADNKYSIHEVFASTKEKAKALLADRYLGQSPRITDYEKRDRVKV